MSFNDICDDGDFSSCTGQLFLNSLPPILQRAAELKFSAAADFDIVLVSNDGLERSRQAAGDVVQGKAGSVGLIDHLSGDEGHVNEAAAALREFFCDGIKHAIHEVIADEGSGGIGNGCGKILGLDAFDHSFDRQ